MRPDPPKKKSNMGSRKLRADIRRHAAAALQHLAAVDKLGSSYYMGLPCDDDSDFCVIMDPLWDAWDALNKACQGCRPWWTNA